jgi:Tfp pilus assembly PilM family ATPase
MPTRLVIEWTRSTARIALAERRKSRSRLLAIRSEAIGPSGDVRRALGALLGAVKPGAAEVIGVVPREHVLTRVLKFPTTQTTELASMVELYAKAQLPYPREQMVIDFHIVQQREGFSTVGIVACQREVVERSLDLLRHAGFSTASITLSSWGVLGWYQLVRSRAQAGVVEEPTLVLNVDDTRTDLVLMADGRMLSSRSIGQGAQDWETSGDTLELLAQEVERSRTSARKELSGTDVRSVLLTGVGAAAAWAEPLAQRLGVSVRYLDGRQPLMEQAMPSEAAISPVVIGGIACGGGESLLTLTPPELRVHAAHRVQVRQLATVSLLLLGVLSVGASLLALEMRRGRRVAEQLDGVIVEIEPVAKSLQDKSRSSKLVTSVLNDRRQLAVIVSGIFRHTEPTLALEAVSFERARREVIVRGSAPSTQAVLDYIQRLQQLDGIRAVRLKYSTRRMTPSGERTDFELLLTEGASAS